MENKEIKNISEFFSIDHKDITPEDKWNSIFREWISKIEEKRKILNLFELKLWFEAIEELLNSPYLKQMAFNSQDQANRHYGFYLDSFSEIISKIIKLLKELDFKKDDYILNFEEFIVEKILEKHPIKSFTFLRRTVTPESWFNNLRIYLQKLKNLAKNMAKFDTINSRAFNSLTKLYHFELSKNPILISLLSGKFIPKLDKIYQADITNVILSLEEKTVKKSVGIFFILSFRILKISNYIEIYLYEPGANAVTIPLILVMKKYIEQLIDLHHNILRSVLKEYLNQKLRDRFEKIIKGFTYEYKKIYEGELVNYFKPELTPAKQKKIIRNVYTISSYAIKELIEGVAILFNPDLSGKKLFENLVSRQEKSQDVKNQLIKITKKIDFYLSRERKISPQELFFDLNLFIETDLNYLLYKDWNEFLKHYNGLLQKNFTTEFDINLRSFKKFLIQLIKQLKTD